MNFEKDSYIKLLERVNDIQQMKIQEISSKDIFAKLLQTLLEATSSDYGFIGEVIKKENGYPFLRTHAITNISWNQQTSDYFKKYESKGLEFHNLKTLFGVTLLSEDPVISNEPRDDTRAGGTPIGHPELKTYLGIPLKSNGTLIGMVGIANREGGYTEEILEFLEPLVKTCAALVESHRIIDGKQVYEDHLQELNSKLEAQIKHVKDRLSFI